MATLLIKFTNEGQYNPSTSTITYEDGTPSRWSSVYSKLKTGDTCIFHSDSNILYIGEFESSILNTSVTFGKIQKTNIKFDDLLRIHLLQPETISVFKRPPGPILKDDIDVNLIFQDISNKKFISFYAIKKGKERSYLPNFAENDRVVLVDESGRISDLCIVENGALKSASIGDDLFKTKGKYLNEILNIHKAIQNDRRSKSSNNVRSIERLIDNISRDGFYQFRSFSEYYNAIHNKSAYNPQLPAGGDSDNAELSDDLLLEDDIDVKHSFNSILYGPPGTGKTYRTIDHALAIIENNTVEAVSLQRENNDEAIKEQFNAYLKQGRIAFCTFHQSMGYEDFIEGIKPLPPDEDKPMQYAVLDGIFKKICTEAAFDLASRIQAVPVGKMVGFSNLYDQFVGVIQERWSRGEAVELKTVSGGSIVVDGISERNNLIVKPKGGDKTYIVSKERLSRLSDGIPDLSAVKNMDAKFRKVIGGSNATAYWAALNAIRKLKPIEHIDAGDLKNVSYEDKKRTVEQFTLKEYDPKDANKFVLIIDEINRGNVAQIFGELITLIEDDKRMGAKMTLKATLPYSNESFSVPPNLYIIGTMNTADRSVEALDTALRRRFSFVKMEPKPEKLSAKKIEDIDLVQMLKTINERLELLIDADHIIGHAWFKDVEDLNGLNKVFSDKILPLLQEFFYNDYEKIGLVLGPEFVLAEKKGNIFAKFNGGTGLGSEYQDRYLFKIKSPKEGWVAEAFISIYSTNGSKV